jgi:hypothetical protein
MKEDSNCIIAAVVGGHGMAWHPVIATSGDHMALSAQMGFNEFDSQVAKRFSLPVVSTWFKDSGQF